MYECYFSNKISLPTWDLWGIKLRALCGELNLELFISKRSVALVLRHIWEELHFIIKILII